MCLLIQNTFWFSMVDSMNDLARVVCLGGLISPSVVVHMDIVILTSKIRQVVVGHLEEVLPLTVLWLV